MSEKVKINIAFRTRYQAALRYAALKLAWQLGMTFTVQGFAAVTGKTVTTNMRRVLGEMVAAGELTSYLAASPFGGRLQRYYCRESPTSIRRSKEVVR